MKINQFSYLAYMGVSENSGTPKSSMLIGFSIINHPFWGTPIFGNTHISPIAHDFQMSMLIFFTKQSHSGFSGGPKIEGVYRGIFKCKTSTLHTYLQVTNQPTNQPQQKWQKNHVKHSFQPSFVGVTNKNPHLTSPNKSPQQKPGKHHGKSSNNHTWWVSSSSLQLVTEAQRLGRVFTGWPWKWDSAMDSRTDVFYVKLNDCGKRSCDCLLDCLIYLFCP